QDCADAQGQHEPDRCQDAGCQRHGDEVVARGPPQVLLHLPVAGPGEVDDRQHRARVGRGQDDTGRTDGDISSGADGDADVGLGQGGGVVDAIADHGDLAALILEFGDLGGLVLGADASEHTVDVKLLGDGVSDRLGVAGDHYHLRSCGVQGVDGFAGFGTDLVSQAECADDPAVC